MANERTPHNFARVRRPVREGQIREKSRSARDRRIGRLALPLVAIVVLGACSSDSGGSALTLPESTTTELPVQTVATTEAPPVTDVSTTEATTTTTTTSTTIESVPLTVLEPATTVIPADVDEVFAEAFAVYEEAWAVRQRAAQDPADADVRADIERLFIDAGKDDLIASLDEQADGPFRSVVDPSRPPSSVTFVEAEATVENGTFVDFKSCEVITTTAIDIVKEEVVFDEILAYSGQVRMRKIGEDWFVSDEVHLSRVEGTTCES